MEKRYVIVRVDNSCPAMLDDFGCIIARNILHCKCGEDAKNYGDTKKQLIKKVAQVLKRETGNDGVVISNRNFEEIKSLIWEDVAEKIIEFLGVKE